ncbi:hypothetical protein [Roseovarius sp. MMSF_3281]|uniref:hypothetical protein n=1 Tax=Roseovarius sp. MMSF_3281 TaxID=3046694 RepID=UPI00273D8266|nr:hypothetical protein [Roseovarius sp. MMSF_3281]
MTRSLRPYLALCLALLLTLTSQTMAIARGAPPPVGQAILCTGTGPVTVLVDAEGQPTGQVHICPDCALHVLDGMTPPPAAIVTSPQEPSAQVLDFKSEILPSLPAAFAARAPPEVV